MRENQKCWYGIPVSVPSASSAEPDDDDDLSELFWRVARQLRHGGKETLDRLDVTPGQARALGVLTRHGLMRLSELSEHLRIAPRSTTEVVDGLEGAGLVERRPDPHDRRATLVAVTERGAGVATEIRAARRAAAATFFGTLEPADRAHLTRILRALS
jgi:DNA-binding MarR family transcriptional regulator